jgi:hypothetical protein
MRAFAWCILGATTLSCGPEKSKPTTPRSAPPASASSQVAETSSATSASAAPACAPGPPSCGPDKKSLIAMACGKETVMQSCLGPGGCTSSGAGVRCDESLSRPGEACRLEQSFGCSPEKDAMTQCRSGKVVLASTCRGLRKCQIGGAVQCDTSIADPGDACASEGRMACAKDAKTLLRCQGGTFNTAEQCKYQPCVIGAGKVLCR